MGDVGHESVGQALLITGLSMGALAASALGRLVVTNLDRLTTAWLALTP